VIKNNTLPLVVPEVKLPKKVPVIKVLLDVSDNELVKIGKEGVLDPDGTRRGPLALDLESMKIIQEYFKKLKRSPTDIELESLAQTWSEHCKHTIFANSIDDIKDGLYKTYIKGATNRIRKEKGKKDFCISVFSDNAGGIVFDKDHIVTHKVETHNSPSALDPFGGAITGIVGVNRDTIGFGMGAKPVGNTFGFCFGYPDDKRALFRDKNLTQKMLPPKRIIDGVIRGVNVGGNCSGIPTVSGFARYDDRFRAKPLVFVGTVGLSPRKIKGKLAHEKEARAGDYIVIVGGKVGADGIHGATFSSVAMDSSSPATAVQIGDPITQKKLSDAIVKEARDLGLYTSITDNGAGGISCSVAEMAKECGGAVVDIEKVPLKYPGLTPWQIWISESQERMTLSVPKSKWKEFNELMESRGVLAVRIGEFNNSKNCVVKQGGKVIMNMSMEFLHNGLPKRSLHAELKDKNLSEPSLPKENDKTEYLQSLLKTGNIGGFAWISEQYDHEVQAGSVIKPQSGAGRVNTDAQVIRPLLSSEKGVVLSIGLYPSYSDIDTYHMAGASIDTAIRNAVACGASLENLAILDNFCWCSSYDQSRLAELVGAVRACYDYAVGYGTPFISGKDSMFNDFKGYDEKGNPLAISIPPTLLISAIGVIPDITKSVTPEFKLKGDIIYILGETHDELGASEYYKLLAKDDVTKIGIDVPQVDFQKNKKVYQALEKAISKGLVASAISVTSGGLAISLAKASLGGMLGANITLKKLPGDYTSADSALFSESQGRIVVTVSKKNKTLFEKLMRGIPFANLGVVSKSKKVVVTDKKGKKIINTDIDKLKDTYHKFSDKMK
jgi:phosphoribosylformylglycinamidine synthase